MKSIPLALSTLLYIPIAAAGTKAVTAAVTIAPLHSLVASVIGDTGTATLITPATGSLHHFHLKPSHIRKLNSAEIVFYIDDRLEHFLLKALRSLPPTVHRISMAQQPDISLLPKRTAIHWTTPHKPDEKQDRYNTHIWLSPAHAQKMVSTIARELSRLYPNYRATYDANVLVMVDRLQALDQHIRNELHGLQSSPFVVFHDAYRYFEHAYQLKAVGAVTANPTTMPSAARVRALRRLLSETKPVCMFSEPQANRKIMHAVTEGFDIKMGVLDPLGAEFEPGANLYFTMMEKLTAQVKNCLS